MRTRHSSHDISRRGFTGLAAAGLSLLPLRAWADAADATPTTLCIICIDCRFVLDAVTFFEKKITPKQYDLVALAGASLAAKFTSQFPDEYSGLWGQVGIASLVHPTITKVMVVDHRECGAYKYVYGKPPDENAETAQHLKVMKEVQPWFVARKLTTEFWLMNKDGTMPPAPLTTCSSLPCPV